MKKGLYFLITIIALSSCCIGAYEEYLGNNMYLSEYDNIDRRILYQEYECASSGIEIIPMTVLEIAHNENWIIAKTGYGREKTERKYFEYWIIVNNYEVLPKPERIKENTTKFANKKEFESFLSENKITLKLKKID